MDGARGWLGRVRGWEPEGDAGDSAPPEPVISWSLLVGLTSRGRLPAEYVRHSFFSPFCDLWDAIRGVQDDKCKFGTFLLVRRSYW